MRVLLRLVKTCPIDESTASGQIVLNGFVTELQTLGLTAQYGEKVAASVRALQAGSSAAGLVSPRILRQALAERRAIDSRAPGAHPGAPGKRSGSQPSWEPEAKDGKAKEMERVQRKGARQKSLSKSGKGLGPCFTCRGPHLSKDCPNKFVEKKKEG